MCFTTSAFAGLRSPACPSSGRCARAGCRARRPAAGRSGTSPCRTRMHAVRRIFFGFPRGGIAELLGVKLVCIRLLPHRSLFPPCGGGECRRRRLGVGSVRHPAAVFSASRNALSARPIRPSLRSDPPSPTGKEIKPPRTSAPARRSPFGSKLGLQPPGQRRHRGAVSGSKNTSTAARRSAGARHQRRVGPVRNGGRTHDLRRRLVRGRRDPDEPSAPIVEPARLHGRPDRGGERGPAGGRGGDLPHRTLGGLDPAAPRRAPRARAPRRPHPRTSAGSPQSESSARNSPRR